MPEAKDPGDAGDAYRDFRRKAAAPPPLLPKGRQLITVVGIDDYCHWPKLGNAVSDARGVLELFEKELFFERACEPLYNAAATKEAVNDLILDELPKTLEKIDSIIFFFAGHGHTETRRVGDTTVERGYLIPWEAEAGKRSDFINVDDLLIALSLLPTMHVLFIIDACHSGIAVGQKMKQHRGEPVKYEDQLRSLVSRKIITSARRDQLALDGGPVPGHSLFTSHLIHGLRTGEADADRNDFVSGRELGLYLQQKVAQASWDGNKQSRQTPDFGEFDLDDRGDLVISLKREQVVSNLAAGRAVRIMGERLNDRARLVSAIGYLDTAIRLSPAPHPEALLERGKANFALARYEAASTDLAAARSIEPESPDVLLYLGATEAMRDRPAPAIEALRAFVALPARDRRKPWAERLISDFESESDGRGHAILIGIGRYQNDEFVPLGGPPNDVELMRQWLLERGDFDGADIRVLTDEEATRARILQAFHELTERAGPNDHVIVHFCGHASSASEAGYLAPYDAAYKVFSSLSGEGTFEQAITEDELHALMSGIPAIARVLILDTHITDRFEVIASSQNAYTVLMATSPRVWARELPMPDNSGENKTYGAFTWALISSLREQPEATLAALMAEVSARVKSLVGEEAQRPIYRGIPNLPLLSQRRRWNQRLLADIDLLSLRRFETLSDARLTRLSMDIAEGMPAWPELRTTVGAALVRRGRFRHGAEALRGIEPPLTREAACILATALVRTGEYEEAAALLRGVRETDETRAAELDAAIAVIETLRESRAHALLVGVDAQTVATGALNDIDQMGMMLYEAGLSGDRIQILKGPDATAQSIRAAFEQLVARAREGPALFYYAGPGTLIDLRTAGVTDSAGAAIPLDWFRSAVGEERTNLTSIFDAGWKSAELPWGPAPGSRYATVRTTPRDLVRPGAASPAQSEPDIDARDVVQSALEEARIGRATFFHVSIRHTIRMAHADLPGETIVEADFESYAGPTRRGGVLTAALIKELRDSQGLRLIRFRRLAEGLRARMGWLEPFLLCDNLDQPVLANTVKEDLIADAVRGIVEDSPFEEAIAALRTVREESRDENARVHIDLAAAYAALRDYPSSIDALEAARRAAGGEDADIDFERGRVLFESGADFDAAVSSLHKAVGATPDRPEAHYYLGAAIRSRVEREAEELDRAVEAFERYLALGAPLGHTSEIEAFLARRRARSTD